MKNVNVEIINFSQGEIAPYILQKNHLFNVTNSCYKLLNMLVDNNKNLVRRPGTTNITNLDSTPVKIFSFELDNKSMMFNFFNKSLEIYIFSNLQEYIKQTLVTYFDAEALAHSLSIVYSSENQEFYIFSEKFHPAILRFDSNMQFLIKELLFIDGPYLNEYGQGVSLTITYINKTKNMIAIRSSENIFSIHDEKRCIKIKQGDNWGSARIIVFLDNNLVHAEIITDIIAGSSNIFKLSSFGKLAGFPKQGLLFENRLYLISGVKNSHTVFISKYGNILDFSDTEIIKDKINNITINSIFYDSAISFTIANSGKNNWLATSKNSVLVGSEKGLYAIFRQDPNQALSPYNIIVKQVSSNESSKLVINSDIGIIFTDPSKKIIYITNISQDMMIGLSKVNTSAIHLFAYPIKKMYLTKEPFYILWVILEDGTLLSASIIEGTFAWSRHDLFGYVQDITSSYVDNKCYLAVIVNRETTFTSLEYINLDEIYTCYFKQNYNLDCKSVALIENGVLITHNMYNNQKITAIDNYTKEEFNEVLINNEQANLANQQLSSNEVFVGYSYKSLYQTPYINIPDNLSSLNLEKQIQSIIINTVNSSNIIVANNQQSNYIDNLPFASANYTTDEVDFIVISPVWNLSKNTQIEITQKTSNNLCICGLRISINI